MGSRTLTGPVRMPTRPALIGRASPEEFSAPYACSANRFMRPSHPCKPAGGPCSHFTPVEPLSHLRFRGPLTRHGRGSRRHDDCAGWPVRHTPSPDRRCTSGACRGRPAQPRHGPNGHRARCPRREVICRGTELERTGNGVGDPRETRPPAGRAPEIGGRGHPVVVRICLVRQYVTTLARSERLRTAEPRLGHFTRGPSRRRSPDARRSSSGRPRPVRLLVRAVQPGRHRGGVGLEGADPPATVPSGVKPRCWRIPFAGHSDADGHRDREDGRAGA